MVRNYLKMLLRNISRHKVYSLVNIFGLALGIACCLMIWMWVRQELSFDRFFPNLDRMGRIIEKHNFPSADPLFSAASPYLLTERLTADYPEIEAATRFRPLSRTLVTSKDKSIYELGLFLADSSFFRVFNFPLIAGDPAKALTGVNSVVIDSVLAVKYFGTIDAVGRSLRLDNRLDVVVTGVMRKFPVNSHLQPQLLISMGTLDQFLDRSLVMNWAYNAFYSYLLMKPGISMESFGEKFKGALHRYRVEGTIIDLQLERIEAVHFGPPYQADIAIHGSSDTILLFVLISAFVLVIAGVNFVNLSTARAAKRTLEISVRKVVGADRGNLIRQFLGESVLIAFASALVALLFVELTLPLFRRIAGQSSEWRLLSDPILMLFLVVTIVAVGVLAGMYPAFYLSSLKPIRGLYRRTAATAFRLRGALVMIQFTIAIAMIIGTTIVYKQISYAQSRDLGFQKEQILTFTLDGREALSRYDALKQELLRLPGVRGVTASAQLPSAIGWAATMWPEGGSESDKIQFNLNPVDSSYFDTYGMQILAGRSFSQADNNDSITPIVINQEAAHLLGWSDPLGHRLNGEGGARLQIIGLVKNFEFATARIAIKPLLLFYDPTNFNTVAVNLSGGDMPGVTQQIKSTWERTVPGRPFLPVFFDETFDALYVAEVRTGRLLWVFSAIAIIVACLGLLGLAAYSVEQRTKETGIRKALGASVSSLVMMHSTQFVRWITAANVIAWPISYFTLNRWLAAYAQRTSMDWWIFCLVGVGALVIALATAVTLAIKAALTNPADVLRYE